MKAGVCSYCFNKPMNDGDLTLAQVATIVGSETQAECFEPLTRFLDPDRNENEQARELADIAREHNLQISCYAQDNNFHLYDEKRNREAIDLSLSRLETAQIIGTNTVRLDPRSSLPGSQEDADVDDLIERMAKSMGEIAEAAEKAGIQIGVENHGRLLGRVAQTQRIIDLVDRPNFGINLDFTNFRQVFGEDHIEATKQFAPCVKHVHAKDFHISSEPKTGDDWRQIPTGEYVSRAVGGAGNSNWNEIFTILHNADYTGTISLEVWDHSDIKGSVIQGVTNMKRLIADAIQN